MYFCGCKRKNKIERKEFLKGMKQLKCNSMFELTLKFQNVPFLLEEWTIKEEQDLFSFIFSFIKGEENVKYISTFQVVKFLENIKEYGDYFFLENFVEFLNFEKRKGINLDQFKLFVNFSYYVKHDFSNYNLDDGWPILYDDFVTFVKNKSKMDIIE
jgi:hypothetical protein